MKSLTKKLLLSSTALIFALSTPVIAAEKYEIDKVHSGVIFKIQHMGAGYTYGRFNDVSGTVMFDEKNPSNSKLDIEVASSSVDTANKKRDKHLRSPDFFNVRQFPKITFKSNKVKKVSNDKYQVTGDLNLHGVTKAVTIDVIKTGQGKDPRGNVLVGAETMLKIDRTDFDMSYMVPGLGKEVTLMISLEGVLK